MAAVVAKKATSAASSLAVHWPSAAGAEQDRCQGVGVLGPGLAGPSHVSALDLLAGLPDRVVDQGRMASFDELSVDQDLAQVGRVADQILEDVAGEDDGFGAVVVCLLLATGRLHILPVQMLGQGPEAEAAGCVESEDLPDHRSRLGVLHDLGADPAVALGDGSEKVPIAAQVAEVVA